MSKLKDLQSMADKLRIHSLKSTTSAGSGHPTSCLSCAEIMSCLFFDEMKKGDEFILSKGHAAPILWAAYSEAGLIPVEELQNLRKINSALEGHPTPRMQAIKVATGSLGQGLATGAGMSLAMKLKKSDNRVYVLLGDGECAEGSVWEAANISSYYRLDNLCAIIDMNKLGQSRETMFAHNNIEYKKRFEAFGWQTAIINGHKVNEILNAFKKAKQSHKPFVIIAKTLKGKGISFLENKQGWHGKALNREELEKALKQIKTEEIKLKSDISFPEKYNYNISGFEKIQYKLGEMIATRDAFGKALTSLGRKNNNIIVLDGDVKDSTRTLEFFKEFPNRSFDAFIAEQCMTGMSIGFSSMGFIPFVSTFAAFLTRAHDFIRMAQYSNANIKFIGSHSGISIGEDGPSQMGLEDISMFLSIPNSIILYPSDAVATQCLVEQMAQHNGISYLRTTRPKTPTIYSNNEKFQIGGLKVIRKSNNDKVLIIAAGITVHEALKAHKLLQNKGINVRVIDLYSIKPVDKQTLIQNAKECNNNVIVVEDHYLGGIGSIVAEIIGKIKHLYVKDIPRSGKPEELMHKYEIDADAIVKTVS